MFREVWLRGELMNWRIDHFFHSSLKHTSKTLLLSLIIHFMAKRQTNNWPPNIRVASYLSWLENWAFIAVVDGSSPVENT